MDIITILFIILAIINIILLIAKNDFFNDFSGILGWVCAILWSLHHLK